MPTVSTVQVISAEGMSLQEGLQVFSVKLRDTSGGIGMWHGELLFFQGSTWVPGYDYVYTPATRWKVGAEMTANEMWVESSSGAYTPVPIGSGSPQAGSNCTLYPEYSSITQTSENTVEVRFAMSFPNTFTGVLQDHVFVTDTLGQSRWDQIPSDPRWNWYVWPSGWGSPPALPGAFTTCIVTPNCSYTLPAATDTPHGGSGNIVPYWIDSTITITAQNVTITGANGAALQRDPNPPSGFPGATPLMLFSTRRVIHSQK